MAEPQDPYTPPRSDITGAPVADAEARKPVFSPVQGAVGTFLGGPLAGTYFLQANFLAKGDRKSATQTALWGIAITLALLISIPFIPEDLPAPVIPIAYAVTVRMIIEKMQFTKAQIASSSTLAFQSTGRIVLVALLGMLLFAGAGVLEFLLFPAYFSGEP